MKLNNRFLIGALVIAGCTSGPTAPLGTSPSSATATGGDDGLVGASAAGDVKTGSGALEIIRLRMDRQSPAGVSLLRQYAMPNATYGTKPGETIELWAEWDPNSNLVPTVIPRNPRLIVEWGDGSAVEAVNCGLCRLSHLYPTPGIFVVKATLDDLSGTSVRRTFT
ncbi:MAG: hypothetical protein ABIR28_04580, partial [Vicinamibacteria bacterium]